MKTSKPCKIFSIFLSNRCSLRIRRSTSEIHEDRGSYYILIWICNNCQCYSSIFEKRRHCVCV